MRGFSPLHVCALAVIQDFKKKEALAAEKAERARQAADDNARKKAEELELKLVAARTKEDKEQGKLRKEAEERQRFDTVAMGKHSREKGQGPGPADNDEPI